MKKQYQWLTLPILLAGFALRVYRLGIQSLWYDETVSAFLAGQSSAELIAHTARDIHPPGYYLLLHFWTKVAGNTEFALSFFSLIFGLLLIPLIYRLTIYLSGSHSAALWAAFLAASSPYNIWYSQEVRMYTVGAVLGMGTAFYALRALAEKHPRRFWLGYAILAAAGLYILYYFVFLLIFINLWLLINITRPKIRLPAFYALLSANVLLLILYLPWLPIAWRQAVNPPVPPWRSFNSIRSVLLESWSALSLGQSVKPFEVWPALLLTFVLFLLGLYYLRRSAALFLLSYSFAPLLIIYLLSFITPLYHVRYIFTYSPPFYIILGSGLAWLNSYTKRLWPAVITAGLLLAASFFSIYQFHFDPRYKSDDYRQTVSFLQSRWQPGDLILINAGYVYPAFLYYADFPDIERRRLIPYRVATVKTKTPLLLQTGTIIDNGNTKRLGWGNPLSDFYGMTTAETETALQKISADFPRLWMLRAYDTVTDPHAVIRSWLADNATIIEDRLFNGETNIRVQGFLMGKLPDLQGEAVRFADNVTLTGWNIPHQNWQPGQTISLKFGWMVTAPTSVDYKISLKLWSSDGKLIAQGQDEWPAGTLYRMTSWSPNRTVYHPSSLLLPSDISPGQYWLNVELYHPKTAQPLSRLDGNDPVVTLGMVAVVE